MSSRLCTGLERESVEFTTHSPLQSGIDHLVLRNARFACECSGANDGFVVIAIAGKVLNLDVGIGESRSQQRFEVIRAHRHGPVSFEFPI
jgi:hypothetical protein